MSSKIEELQRKRAELRNANEAKKAEQFETDLEALLELETEHGVDRVRKIDTERFVEGLTTMVVVKTPAPVAYKRFVQEVNGSAGKPAKILEAQDRFASVAWVYPADEETKEKLRTEFPEILSAIAEVASSLCKLKVTQEGKG